MKKAVWANFFHMYQPPDWNERVVRRVIRECYRPFFHQLVRRPSFKITLDICGSLTEQLESLGARDILSNIQLMVARKQIELTATVKYHVLAPLLPESEIHRQITLNDELHQSVFGAIYNPRGFYLPEMCYSKNIGRLIAQLGYDWTILDEITLSGVLGTINFDQGYRLDNTKLNLVFRNRTISDLFFMDVLKSPAVFFKVLQRDPRMNRRLVTGVDLENLGHHNPRLLKIWFSLTDSRRYQLVTISELIRTYRRRVAVQPVASNWASRESELKHKLPYYLWKNKKNPIQQLQWRLTKLILQVIRSSHQPYAQQSGARQLLDKALASDQYWWASASPWWSVEIVAAGAQKLLTVLKLIKCPKSTCRQAQKLCVQIIAETRRWQRSGIARTVSQTYLNTESFTRIFGGKKVK